MKDFGSANFILATSLHDNGEVSISAAVKGFWSMDTISAYARCYSYKDVEWTYSISTSSGGRDPKVVESDIDAYAYYAEALLAVTQELQKHKDNASERTKMFETESARIQAQYEAEKKARYEAWESETPITLEEAKAIIKTLSAEAESSPICSASQTIHYRGTAGKNSTTVRVSLNSRNRSFWIGAQRYSYDALLKELTVEYVL